MADFYEIDFLDVETDKSGDAIPLRYSVSGSTLIHVVDGGFQDTGPSVVQHVQRYYGNPTYIDHVVVTHPDGDHAAGLVDVLESFRVGQLWMLRPWIYANELLPYFNRMESVESLVRRLRGVYPNIATLEDIAIRRGIPIAEPFQGATIGLFRVLAPSPRRYGHLILASERTPESEVRRPAGGLLADAFRAAAGAVRFIRSAWGAEVFSGEETSAENEMSVVQYANLCGSSVLLTGDAGRGALGEAADYAPRIGVALPGIARFQIPHHGSRRNVSTELLDRFLGPRLSAPPAQGQERFTAVVSAAKRDADHPRKAVVRAHIHRGARVLSTEQGNLRISGGQVPARDGLVPAVECTYPDDQEEA